MMIRAGPNERGVPRPDAAHHQCGDEQNVPVGDALSATVNAMGQMICILSERPGTSADDLIKWCQRVVPEFIQEALARRAEERTPKT